MANSSATLTLNKFPNGIDQSFNHLYLYGTLTLSAGNYVANGIPITLSFPDVPTPNTPFVGYFYSASSGYVYVFDPTNQSIRIFQGGSTVSSPGAELTAGAALPAGVTGDTIQFEFIVQRG